MKNQISARQLCTAGFAGLLALSAAAAWLDWRGALLAVPVVALSVWAAYAGARQAGGLLKNPGGRPLALLYIVWGVFLAGAGLALCGTRMSGAGSGSGPLWPTMLAALPVLWLAVGKPEAYARAAEIFSLAMLAVLAFIALLGAGQVELRWVLAPGASLLSSFLTAAGIGCTGVYALLLWNGRGERERRRFLAWSAAGTLVLAGMAAYTVGSLSPALAGSVKRPFFLMTVGLGQTARVESLTALLWLASDVTLLGLLCQSARGLWRDVLGLAGEKWAGAACTAAALAAALVLERYGAPEALLRVVIPVGGLLLGCAGPVLLWALGKIRKGPVEEPISGGEDGQRAQIFGASEGAEKKLKKSKKRA